MDEYKAEALRKNAEEIKELREAIQNKSGRNKTKVRRPSSSFLELPKANQLFVVVYFASILGPFLYLLLSKNFVPSVVVKQSAFYISLLFSIAVSLLMVTAAYTGKLPKARNKKTNKLITLISVPLMPFFIYGWFWLNFAIVVPQIVSDAVGVPITETATAKKWTTTSRYSCDYNLRLEPYASFYFGFCLTESMYAKLPENEFRVKVHLVESLWGKSVLSVELDGVNK